MSPNNRFWLAFFKIFSSTVRSLIKLHRKKSKHFLDKFINWSQHFTNATLRRLYLPVDVNVSRLTDAMTSVLRLSVHSRIPIRIVENDSVSSSQIDTNAAGSSRQYEAKYARVGVESLH